MVELNENNLAELEYFKNGDINATELWFKKLNTIKIKPHLFDKYKSLQELYLYELNLSEIPRGLFRHLSQLEIIDLHNNKLQTIDADTFAGNQKIKIIHLFDNEIEFLPLGVFDNLVELEELKLGWNQLTSFDFNSLKDSPKIRCLNLQNNKLVDVFHFDVHKILWPNLSEINLTNNKIVSVQDLRDRSDPEIVELDLPSTDEKGKLEDAAKEGMKQLILELEEEKKQCIQDMEIQKSKWEEEKKDLLAEIAKMTIEREMTMDLSNILNNFPDLVIKELNKKLSNLTIRILDQQETVRVVPAADEVINCQTS